MMRNKNMMFVVFAIVALSAIPAALATNVSCHNNSYLRDYQEFITCTNSTSCNTINITNDILCPFNCSVNKCLEPTSADNNWQIAVIAGLSSITFLFIYIGFKLREEHWALQLMFIIFALLLGWIEIFVMRAIIYDASVYKTSSIVEIFDGLLYFYVWGVIILLFGYMIIFILYNAIRKHLDKKKATREGLAGRD